MVEKYVLPGGTTRSEQAPNYLLVPRAGLDCIVKRFELGEEAHGSWQWMKSLDTMEHARQFCGEAINHMNKHLQDMMAEGTEEDDHLGAIGWAVCALAYARSRYGEQVLPVQPTTYEEMPYESVVEE
jgi:hypothetical protein